MDLTHYVTAVFNDETNHNHYLNQKRNYWTSEELNFHDDAKDYKKASPNIQRVFKIIFAVFIHLDGVIADGLSRYTIAAAKKGNWAAFYYYTFQTMMENTHAETYTKAIKTILADDESFLEVVDMIRENETISKKSKWSKDHIDNCESDALSNVARAVTEGIHFISLFSVIFRFRAVGIFTNFITANEFISRDEMIHRDQACDEAKKELKEDEKVSAIALIKEGVELELEFLKFILSEPVYSKRNDEDIGMTYENVSKYIKTLADHISTRCGLGNVYGERVELSWMSHLGLSNKNNFHEISQSADYMIPTKVDGSYDIVLNPENMDF